ncbi:MAG: cbb3-type cytochrome c oxidase subunit I, partial [Alphaproteobacteria bacterium]|nr:cbb3-type cytochrome c oxidase subunit I [Alphaproteobacteria bacterium]
MPITATPESDTPSDVVALFLFLGIAAVLALLATGLTDDAAFRFHGYILMAASVLALSAMTIGVAHGRFRSDPKRYEDGVIRAGVIATMFWGVIGMTVGVFIAAQLSWPEIFYFPEHGWLNFGRLRPLHTSGVIFAFGGNALICTSFWVVQRTCKARLAGGIWPWFVFWGYQLFIVLAATGYVSGITQSREYAEPEWYVDIWLTIVCVAYLFVFLGTIWKRKEPHIYVANWFYLAFIVTVALLHLVNNAAVPVGLLEARSYSAFGGVQDALVQWWYGHNAVGFFLTAGFLAMMYYFVPKRVERPVYSYRLSIVHFWSLIFIYIWAGPHHL